ncbi:MAG: hypothetical protein K8U03_16315 [Planctomycetia bacterium]|nr:hypothetical protein [Planctomycetia bacterium]
MKFFAASVLVLTSVVVTSFSGALRAEVNDKILTDVYHQGLKTFYAGQYAEAHDVFTQAIDGGTKDPRAYYFRGLANSRLGRAANAKADFEKGAVIEGKDFDVFFNVSTALERIQGNERRTLESYRAAGRKHALAEIDKIRFEHFRRFDPNEGVPGAATTSSGTGLPAGQVPAAATEPAAMPATPGAAPANPFGTPAPANAPANPFGTPAPAAPATPPAKNPFGN